MTAALILREEYSTDFKAVFPCLLVWANSKKENIEGGFTSINVNNLPNGIYYITFLVNHTAEKKIFVLERSG